ncbi:unnamed protein product [Darwinula stevensoni]|uniref:Phosphatidic acid phosphatase type 2/haloperoxidase domain-containing protein n=1 Tax=Darwinula stevensoni TaxID=69355 RepID=A0A7R8X9J2_9CRUS|nr:unnamed protein product [Darwinula stevensoni]CAG0889193.1 unnamed protein product [Darwinula stevensoni]
MVPFYCQIHAEEAWLYEYPYTPSFVPTSVLWVSSEHLVLFTHPFVIVVPPTIFLLWKMSRTGWEDFQEAMLAFSLALGLNGVITNIIKLVVVSFASMGFVSLYLAGKLQTFSSHRPPHNMGVLAPVVPLVFALAIALSRTCDYHHHWQDVAVGSAIGIAVSHYIYFMYYPSLKSPHSGDPHQSTLKSSRLDQSLRSVAITGSSKIVHLLHFHVLPYNILCITTAFVGVCGATYQLVTIASQRHTMGSVSSYVSLTSKGRQLAIICWLALADLLAALGILVRAAVWLIDAMFMLQHTFTAQLFCAILSAWSHYFYTVTYMWTLIYALDMWRTLQEKPPNTRVYHLCVWGSSALLSGIGVSLLYAPSLDCHQAEEYGFWYILPSYLSTYIPILLVMIANPIIYRMAFHKAVVNPLQAFMNVLIYGNWRKCFYKCCLGKVRGEEQTLLLEASLPNTSHIINSSPHRVRANGRT